MISRHAAHHYAGTVAVLAVLLAPATATVVGMPASVIRLTSLNDEITEVTVPCKCRASFRSTAASGMLLVSNVVLESAWHCSDGHWVRSETGVPGLPQHGWELVEGCDEIPGP